jgi:hypothetical protein
MIGTYNAKFDRKVVLLCLTKQKGHALPENTDVKNSLLCRIKRTRNKWTHIQVKYSLYFSNTVKAWRPLISTSVPDGDVRSASSSDPSVPRERGSPTPFCGWRDGWVGATKSQYTWEMSHLDRPKQTGVISKVNATHSSRLRRFHTRQNAQYQIKLLTEYPVYIQLPNFQNILTHYTMTSGTIPELMNISDLSIQFMSSDVSEVIHVGEIYNRMYTHKAEVGNCCTRSDKAHSFRLLQNACLAARTRVFALFNIYRIKTSNRLQSLHAVHPQQTGIERCTYHQEKP